MAYLFSCQEDREAGSLDNLQYVGNIERPLVLILEMTGLWTQVFEGLEGRNVDDMVHYRSQGIFLRGECPLGDLLG